MEKHKEEVDLNIEDIQALTDAQPSPLEESLEISIKRMAEDSKLQKLATAVRSAVLYFYGIPLYYDAPSMGRCNSYTHAKHPDRRADRLSSTKSLPNAQHASDKRKRKASVQAVQQDADHNAFVFEAKAFLNNVTLLRALRARKWDSRAAIELLIATVEWRRTNVPRAYSDPASLSCCVCASDPCAHSFMQVGWSSNNRAIMFSSISQYGSLEAHGVCRHIFLTLEQVFSSSSAHPQWIWVLDIKGFGFRHVSVELARTMIDVFTKHYCERLGAVIVVKAPPAFLYLWSVVSRMLEAHTKEKVKFTKSNSELRELLTAMVDNKSTVDWLEAAQGANVMPLLPTAQIVVSDSEGGV